MNKAITLIACLITIIANAQEDTSKAKLLSDVVITGQYKPQSVRNSVYQVRTISKEIIQKLGASKIEDVLGKEINFRFSQDASTGGSGITMLGLRGQNVKVLLDGVPVTGRQGVSNEIDINQIDINSIERIEIVEGPMSVIYGADALAGVINIITTKASHSKLSVTANIHEETIGNEYGISSGIHNQFAGISWKNKKWEAGGGISKNYFGGWKDTATGRELVWHKKDQIKANAYAGFNAGRLHLRYRIDGLDEIITNPGNFLNKQQDSGDTLAYDQEYLSQRVMQQLQGSWSANNSLGFQSQISYSNYSRQVFSTTVSIASGERRLNPDPASQSLVEFKTFTFRGTAFYKLSPSVSFQPGFDFNLESGNGERLSEGNNRVNDFAGFISSEIIVTKGINIRPGLRFIHNSVYNAPPVIPSLNTKFKLASNIDLRLAYAKGFRAPSLRELYFNFFDANHQILGNPDLKAEISNSFTGSVNWKKKKTGILNLEANISGFYNDIENMIDFAVDPSDPNLYRYMNISNSKTRGFTLNSMLKYKKLSASIGGGATGFYNIYYETDRSLPIVQWSSEFTTQLGYSIEKCGLDLNLAYKFTGKQPHYILNSNQEIILSELKGYHLADLSINKKLGKMLMLNAGLRNIFDVKRISSTAVSTGVHSDGGSRNIASGRSVFAGLTFNWNKK